MFVFATALGTWPGQTGCSVVVLHVWGTESRHRAQAGLEFIIILPQFTKYWDYKVCATMMSEVKFLIVGLMLSIGDFFDSPTLDSFSELSWGKPCWRWWVSCPRLWWRCGSRTSSVLGWKGCLLPVIAEGAPAFRWVIDVWISHICSVTSTKGGILFFWEFFKLFENNFLILHRLYF